MHICNNRLVMIEYQKHSIKIDRFTFNGVLPERKKIQLRLDLKNNSENLILNFQNVYYLLNSFCSLVNLKLLNNSGIYHDNKYKNFYQIRSKKILVQAKY